MDVARMHGCHVHQTEGSICVDARSKVSFQRWLLDWAIASWALRMSLLFGRCFAEVGWIFFFFASFDVGLFHFDPFAQHTPRKVTTRNILVTLSKWNLFFYWVFLPQCQQLRSGECPLQRQLFETVEISLAGVGFRTIYCGYSDACHNSCNVRLISPCVLSSALRPNMLRRGGLSQASQ